MGLVRHARIAGILCTVLSASAAQGGTYTFTRIADSTGGYSAFSTPSINNNGTAAFLATTGGTPKIFTGAGGAVITALDPATAGLSNPIDAPSINDGGRIAFVASGPTAQGPTAVNAYRLDPGGTVTKVFDASGAETYFATMAVDDTVYFQVKVGATNQFLASGNGGAGTQKTPSINKATPGYHRLGLAPNGQFALSWHTTAGGELSFILVNGTGVDTSSLQQPVTNMGDSDINSSGTAVFSAQVNGGFPAFYRYNSGTFTQIASAQAIPAINDHDIVAALFTTGTKHLAAGKGSPTDTILSVGDAFMGSTVTDLNFENGGLNEQDQLAFYATLADGRQGIFVTTVPEPTAIGLVAGVLLVGRRRGRSAK